MLEGTQPHTSARGSGTRKKGRPAAFQEEDIDWTSLTPEERRKIRRRLSNRASAHRVRQRRLEMMDSLQSKVRRTLQHLHSALIHKSVCLAQIQLLHQQQGVMIARMQAGEDAQQQLRAELAVARERWATTAEENMRVHADNTMLRRLLDDAKVCCCCYCCVLISHNHHSKLHHLHEQRRVSMLPFFSWVP